ncbi:MAG TPA: DoxX family protein [Candidatus Paceibacterota bacterium]
MLSIFPFLLSYKLLAPFILRITLGLIFVNYGWAKINRQKDEKVSMFEKMGLKPGLTYVWIVAAIEIIVGLLMIVGLWTQVAALIALIILAIALILKKKQPESLESSNGLLIICLVIALSLLFTGPGSWAFDMPL